MERACLVQPKVDQLHVLDKFLASQPMRAVLPPGFPWQSQIGHSGAAVSPLSTVSPVPQGRPSTLGLPDLPGGLLHCPSLLLTLPSKAHYYCRKTRRPHCLEIVHARKIRLFPPGQGAPHTPARTFLQQSASTQITPHFSHAHLPYIAYDLFDGMKESLVWPCSTLGYSGLKLLLFATQRKTPLRPSEN